MTGLYSRGFSFHVIVHLPGRRSKNSGGFTPTCGVDQRIELLTCSGEVAYSNPSRRTEYSDSGFAFSSSLHANSVIVSYNKPRPLLSGEQGYRRRFSTVRASSPVDTKEFYLFRNVQTSLLFKGYRVPSPGVKQLRSHADNSPPSSSEVKNEWSITSSPPTI